MKLFKGKSKKKRVRQESVSEEDLVGFLKLSQQRIPEGYTEVETYPLKPPFSYACIAQDEDTAEYLYVVDELSITKEERETYKRLRNLLEYELKTPEPDENLTQSFHRQLPEILKSHQSIFEGISPIGTRKILYYLDRDLIGYGKIDPFMFDMGVEDISCSGLNKSIYLWHRKHENIKTNVVFRDEEELDDFIMRIVHRAGKHVSIAFPIVDLTLPKKHRLAVSFGRETTPAGTSFTIRKFRGDPFTIVDLVKNETIDEAIAAYLWLLMENKMSVMVVGATGAGKTTALNAIACLTKPDYKIITVEEVAEINLPHENWTSSIARAGFGGEQQGEITLYDLIKVAVRHRPDLIVVGEVRGEEAYVLFQALATGHGGLCTLHAEDVETAIKRLTQPPMNISPGIISLMDSMIVVKHVKSPVFFEGENRPSGRRFVRVSEIQDVNTIHDVFLWNLSMDNFQQDLKGSILLSKIAGNLDVSLEILLEEFERRKRILKEMVEHDVRDFKSVNRALSRYYKSPRLVREEFFERDNEW